MQRSHTVAARGLGRRGATGWMQALLGQAVLPAIAPVRGAGVRDAARGAAGARVESDATEARTYELATHAVVSLDAAPGLHVRVDRGRVWATQEDRPGDFLPGAGDTVAFGGRGRIVVEALRPSRIVVEVRRPATPPARRRLAVVA